MNTYTDKLDELNIDRGVRPFIVALWNAGCETLASCDGDDGGMPRVVLKSPGREISDIAEQFDFRKVVPGGDCCERMVCEDRAEMAEYGFSGECVTPICRYCGAGVYGRDVYVAQ